MSEFVRYGEVASDANKAPVRRQFDIENRVEDSSYYNLKKMNQLHHEIVRRIVLGQKDVDIADALGCTPATVKYTRESPVVKEKLSIMMGARDSSVMEIRERIQKLTPLALAELEKMLIDDNVSAAIRTKIAQDLMDRAGFTPVHKTLDVGKYTESKIEEIKRRARENGVAVATDIDSEEVEDGE